MKILYLLYAFPALSETFIVNEITKLMELGYDVYIAALFDMKDDKIHDRIREYDLLRNTVYLRHDSSFHPKGLERRYSDAEISKEVDERLDEDSLKLLEICSEINEDSKAKRIFLDCLDLIDVIKEKRIRHIHCHFAKENVNMAYALHKFIGMPYTFTTHANDIFVDVKEWLKDWADSAKKVITISEYNKKYMINKTGISGNNISVIHCGVDINRFSPADHLSDKKINILSVARLVEKKGIKYLIEACNILKDKDFDFECNIFGSGPLKEDMQNLIDESGVGEDVHLCGEVSQEEVLHEFRKSSVFVLPCIEAEKGDKDGIPVSLIEAMAMGIPVISTDVSGIPELIDNNISGVLVPQRDHLALAEAIIKIGKDKLFSDKIWKRGREKVKEEFDIDKNAECLGCLYLQSCPE